MFRKALIVAALVSAGAASAQDGASADPNASQQAELITAAMLEEARIVSLEGQYNEDIWQGGDPLSAMVADLQEIGKVQNVVLNVSGQMQGLTADVGGFLGIGTKQVLIPLDDMRLVRPQDEADDITVITRLNQQQLTDLPEFEMED